MDWRRTTTRIVDFVFVQRFIKSLLGLIMSQASQNPPIVTTIMITIIMIATILLTMIKNKDDNVNNDHDNDDILL